MALDKSGLPTVAYYDSAGDVMVADGIGAGTFQTTTVGQLREALRVVRKRVPTKPSRASKERRLEEKRRRAALKRLRRDPG